MLLRVEEYVREDGSSPFRQWFDRLDSPAAAKVTAAMMRLSLRAAKQGAERARRREGSRRT
jgi:hypothetical protein